VRAIFGEPTDWGSRNSSSASLYKYDSVELHFVEERLWAVHCEVGPPPEPHAVLGLTASASAVAQDVGVVSLPVADHLAGEATVFTAGFATLYLLDDGGWCGLWRVWLDVEPEYAGWLGVVRLSCDHCSSRVG